MVSSIVGREVSELKNLLNVANREPFPCNGEAGSLASAVWGRASREEGLFLNLGIGKALPRYQDRVQK